MAIASRNVYHRHHDHCHHHVPKL